MLTLNKFQRSSVQIPGQNCSKFCDEFRLAGNGNMSLILKLSEHKQAIIDIFILISAIFAPATAMAQRLSTIRAQPLIQ